MRPRDRSEFGIAIICALPHEADPVEALFDETYDRFGTIYGKGIGDQNSYITGKLGLHNVVLCIMPGIGRGPAASVASSLRLSFTGIQLALVVGICGATPYPSGQPEIFLGDVIISDSVVQYDFGKQYPGGFERKADVTDTLGRPSQEIRALLRSLQTRRSASEFRYKTSEYLEILHKDDENWRWPVSDDILFEPSFAHKHRTGASSRPCDCFDETNTDAICKTAMGTPCATLGCNECRLIRRRSNAEGCATSIHIGKIASADTVMKSGTKRDEIAQLEKVLGFEMEGAGVWDNIPCIIIKGVCDYADSHKSKEWQNYAAAVGASAAKSFLSIWTVSLRQVQLNAQDIPRVGRFVGRTEELEELRAQLVRVSIYDRIVVLQGPPGIGKSSLVARYIEESHESYSAIFWLDASSPIHLAVSFTKARNQIEGTQQHTSPVERIQGGVSFVKDSYRRYRGKQSPGLWNAYATSEDVQFVRKWLSRKGNVHWLLAFDNYCPPGPEENDQDPLIKAFLPEKPQGQMVITTHSHLPMGQTIRVEKMKSADQGLQILSGCSGQKDVLKDQDALKLVTQMDGLPLALVAAGTYLSQTLIRCREYLELLEENWAEVQEETPRLAPYKGNLDSCWAVAFGTVKKSPGVQRILYEWIGLHSQDAWAEILSRAGENRTDFNRAMKLLRDHGIVEPGPDPCDETLGSRGYNMQRSFHAWLRSRHYLKIGNLPRSTLDCVLDSCQKVIDSGTYYEGLLRLLPHMNTCLDLLLAGKTDHYKTYLMLPRDTATLNDLAKSFRFVGYGKSKTYSQFSAMVRMQNPRGVHFIRAQQCLLYAMRKLEQASTMDVDHDRLRSLKVMALRELRVVYLCIPDMQQLEATSQAILSLSRVLNRHQDVQRERENLQFEYVSSRVLSGGVVLLYFLMICIWIGVLKSVISGDAFRQLLIVVESCSMGLSWTAFMLGWKNRRKTFPLYVCSFLVFMGHSIYDDGSSAFRLGGLPMLAMAISTIPVLYYEVLT